jgi:hypothetical protein
LKGVKRSNAEEHPFTECQKVTVGFFFTLLNPAFGGFAIRNSTGQVALVGIDLVDGKPLLLELAQDLGVDRIHGLLWQPAAEAGEGGLIRSGLAEGQTEKYYENCVLKIRVIFKY